MFGLDLRSLAAFRIAAAICIIGDLRVRSSDLFAHYTDGGILPRNILIEFFSGQWVFSFHLANGSIQFQTILFILAAVFAVMMLIGYRTKTAVFFSWLLLLSVHNRNPMVLQGGDVLFRMILFWSLFLPLGARYSVDYALKSNSLPEKTQILSFATLGYLIQICVLYWGTFAIKMTGYSKTAWWDEGMAVHNALSVDQFTLPLGYYLLGFPLVLKALNYAVIIFEAAGPFFLFMPFFTAFFRTAGVFFFLSMHIGIALCMLIGPFTWIGAISAIPFLPGAFWDKLAAWRPRRVTAVFYDGDCGFCKRMSLLIQTVFFLPRSQVQPAQTDIDAFEAMQRQNSWVVRDTAGDFHYKFDAFLVILEQGWLTRPLAFCLRFRPLAAAGTFVYEHVARRRPFYSRLVSGLEFRPLKIHLGFAGNVLAAASLAIVILWNLANIRPLGKWEHPWWRIPGYMLGFDQYWNMFSPPLLDDGWYVIPGKLRDGSEVDVYRDGAPVDWSKPRYVYKSYKNTRWRKYLMNIWSANHTDHRLYYGRFLCRQWNAAHPFEKQLEEFQIYFNEEMTKPYMSPMVRPVSIWHHYCFQVPANTQS